MLSTHNTPTFQLFLMPEVVVAPGFCYLYYIIYNFRSPILDFVKD